VRIGYDTLTPNQTTLRRGGVGPVIQLTHYFSSIIRESGNAINATSAPYYHGRIQDFDQGLIIGLNSLSGLNSLTQILNNNNK
jgi:hypothetical protein